MKLYLLVELVLCYLVHVVYLQDGNGESDGLNIRLINDTIYEALKKTEFFDNVVRIASWNIYDDPSRGAWKDNREEICKFLKGITPMVSVPLCVRKRVMLMIQRLLIKSFFLLFVVWTSINDFVSSSRLHYYNSQDFSLWKQENNNNSWRGRRSKWLESNQKMVEWIVINEPKKST